MPTAAECYEKSADFAKRARSASSDKQAILYGMGWMWMNMGKHAELRDGKMVFEPSAGSLESEGAQ